MKSAKALLSPGLGLGLGDDYEHISINYMNKLHIVKALKNIPHCIVKEHGLLVGVFYVREDFPVCAYDITICG